VSIGEHYNIHYSQGDYGACVLLSRKMKMSGLDFSNLAKKTAQQRVANGTHHLLGPDSNRKRIENGTHNFLNSGLATEWNLKRVESGKHHFLGESNPSRRKVKNGTHHFLGGATVVSQLANGTHTSQIKLTCPHCSKTVSANMFGRWHGENCRYRN
jgi:hypothetical protein